MHRQTVFDQLDLEIIDQVYEAAWAQLLARDPAHDATEEASVRSRYADAVRLSRPAQWTSTCSATGC